jgi:hypothetical protein
MVAAWDPSIPPLTEWVAVLGVAGTVEELDEHASVLLRRVPDHGLFGRVDSHEGLAEHLSVPPSTWVSGVVASTRPELERALAEASDGTVIEPLVVGEFRVRRLAE